VGACWTGLLRFPLANSSSWFPNQFKGAVTRFLIVPRKDELWRTSFACRRSLLEGDTIDDEQSSATVNSKRVTQKVTVTYVLEVAKLNCTSEVLLDATGSLALHRLRISNTDCSMGVRIYYLLIYSVLNHPISLRHYIGIFRQEDLLVALQSRFDHLSSVHNFHPIEFQPQRKDGGVFVRFSYTAKDEQPSRIENSLREELAKHGALPSWLGLGRGTIWLVKGIPWKEVKTYLNIILTQ
jgi:hypothetical protein